MIHTARLHVRQFTRNDAAFILSLLNSPGWLQYIGDRQVYDLPAAQAYLERGPIASYAHNGFGLFALERKADGAVIGTCGLIRRPGLDDVDIGYALLPGYEGQGYAYEAAAATLDFARDTVGLLRVVAITTVDNERSARLLQRIGLAYEATIHLEADPEPLHLYAIDFQSITKNNPA